jgi:hypothetical protein
LGFTDGLNIILVSEGKSEKANLKPLLWENEDSSVV